MSAPRYGITLTGKRVHVVMDDATQIRRQAVCGRRMSFLYDAAYVPHPQVEVCRDCVRRLAAREAAAIAAAPLLQPQQQLRESFTVGGSMPIERLEDALEREAHELIDIDAMVDIHRERLRAQGCDCNVSLQTNINTIDGQLVSDTAVMHEPNCSWVLNNELS